MAKTQSRERFAFATAVGTGFAVSKPAFTPFMWHVLGYYSVSKRFSVGIGSGVSLYEKALIPLFAAAKFTIERGRKFTPYLECGAGYSFASGPKANGGFYLNPSAGLLYSLGENRRLFWALGYEGQKLERLKTQQQAFGTVEWVEKLNHASVSVKIGLVF